MIGQHFLGQRFVARQHESARIAAGIGHMQQLEIGHHILVIHRHAVEFFEQIEGDVRTPVFDRRPDHPQIASHSQRAHVVTQFSERRHYVVFGFPSDLAQIMAIELIGRDEIFMHQHENPQSPHNATRCRPLRR